MPEPTRGTISVGVAFIASGPRVAFTLDGHERLLGAKAAHTIGDALLRAAAVSTAIEHAADVLLSRDFDQDTVFAILDEMSDVQQDYTDDGTTIVRRPHAGPNGEREEP